MGLRSPHEIALHDVTWLVHNGAMQTPTPFIAPEVFDNAEAALERVQAIYTQSVRHLRDAMRRYVAG
jgi:AMP nucleosidase